MKTAKNILYLCLICIQAVTLFSCEKADFGDNNEGNSKENSNVTFNISNFEQIPFDDAVRKSRTVTDASQLCTRIELAVFNETGKVKATNQTITDDNFGTISLNIPDGDYQVVIIAHSGTGTATLSSPDKITFKDNKVTDTFYHYGTITVKGGGSFSISLKRAVAMVRFIIDDNTPADIRQMEFYYTGGSSTFNAVTGFGCVNSRQTEKRDVASAAHGSKSTYEVYTFPHETEDVLKLTVKALGADGTALTEREFTDVPVKKNTITVYHGEFFGSQTSSGNTFTLSGDNEWSGTNEVAY